MKIKKLIVKTVLIFVVMHLFFYNVTYNVNANFLQRKNSEPAAFEFDNVISTTSLKGVGCSTGYPNYSEDSIDITETKENIVRELSNNSYGILSGTSMSISAVSAEIGLLSSIYNYYSINNSISLLQAEDSNSINIEKNVESEDNNKNIIDKNKYQFHSRINWNSNQSTSTLPYGNRVLDSVDNIRVLNLYDDFGNDFDSSYRIYIDYSRFGKINYEGDEDVFKFIAPMTGDYTFSSSGYLDLYACLYDEEKKLIATNDNISNVDRNFRITHNLIANKTYYIKVKHCSNTSTGYYRLKVDKVDNEGDDFYSANSISPGHNYKAAIDFSGDIDFYKFTPTIDGQYSISTTGNTNTYGYLYDDNEVLLASNDDSDDKNFKITYTLTANKTYYAKVRRYSNIGTGEYTFNITRINEEGNDFSSAKIISPGRNYKAAIDFSGDKDFYKFTPTTTGAYCFYSKGEIDTIGYLYDNNKNLISKNDNSGSGSNFKIIKNLIANETYYLKVNSALTTNIGDYSVGVQSIGLTEAKTSKSEFIFIISGKDIESSSNSSTVRVTYDPSEIDVIDLCAMTSKIETELGKIDGTNLEIKLLKQGEIVFEITNTIDSDKTWTGVLNGIKFKNKTLNEVKVSYSIE